MDSPVAHPLARGTWDCPACDRLGASTLVEVTRGGAPIGRYVECGECFRTFPAEAWDRPGEYFKPNHLDACLRTMLLMTLADGRVVEDEIGKIAEIYPHVGGPPLAREDLLAEIAGAGQADPAVLEATVAALAGGLNEQGKLAVIRGAYEIATADGDLHQRERELLATLALALGVPDPLDPSRADGSEGTRRL